MPKHWPDAVLQSCLNTDLMQLCSHVYALTWCSYAVMPKHWPDAVMRIIVAVRVAAEPLPGQPAHRWSPTQTSQKSWVIQTILFYPSFVQNVSWEALSPLPDVFLNTRVQYNWNYSLLPAYEIFEFYDYLLITKQRLKLKFECIVFTANQYACFFFNIYNASKWRMK